MIASRMTPFFRPLLGATHATGVQGLYSITRQSLSSISQQKVEAAADTSPDTTPASSFVIYPDKRHFVKMLRTLAKKIDAGQPTSFPCHDKSGKIAEIPTPAVGFWRKQGVVDFFIEVEPKPDGTKEIELEIKWCDTEGKKEEGSIDFKNFSLFLRRLANTLNHGEAHALPVAGGVVQVPATHNRVKLSVEYEVEDGKHELEIKVVV